LGEIDILYISKDVSTHFLNKNNKLIMSIVCKCKKDYTYRYKTSNDSPWFETTMFFSGVDYFFYNKGKEFYVSTKEEYLRHMYKWNAMIEDMDELKFDEHFDCEKKMNTKDVNYELSDISKNWLTNRNNIVEKISNNLFDTDCGVSEVDKKRYKMANEMLGYEKFILPYVDNINESRSRANRKKKYLKSQNKIIKVNNAEPPCVVSEKYKELFLGEENENKYKPKKNEKSEN